MRSTTTTTTTTTAGRCRLWPALLLMLLALLLQVDLAAPAWWRHNDPGYDASLDPVAWSRAFVQDKVRRPRISRLGAPQQPALSGHRVSWWRTGYRNGNYNNHGGSRRGSNYKQFVRRHRKRMTLRHTTKLSQSTSD